MAERSQRTYISCSTLKAPQCVCLGIWHWWHRLLRVSLNNCLRSRRRCFYVAIPALHRHVADLITQLGINLILSSDYESLIPVNTTVTHLHAAESATCIDTNWQTGDCWCECCVIVRHGFVCAIDDYRALGFIRTRLCGKSTDSNTWLLERTRPHAKLQRLKDFLRVNYRLIHF